MADLNLDAAFRRYEYNDELLDEQPHDGITFKIAKYEGALLTAMRKMLHEQAYDVCEMSPSSYLLARQAGVPLIGLPVFPFRQYALGQIVVREDSALQGAKDLAGKKIAVRTWAQPTALWVRSYLMDYLGVDLKGVTWLFIGEDPVPGLRRPEGAISRKGETLESLLATGAADAVIGLHEVPTGGRRLIPDHEAAAAQWTRDIGYVPANHMVVVNAKHEGTDVLPRVCQRFADVVREYMATHDPKTGVIGDLKRINPGMEPLPSGSQANEKMWTALVGAMVRQGMLDPVDDPMSLLYRWEPAGR